MLMFAANVAAFIFLSSLAVFVVMAVVSGIARLFYQD